MSASLLVQNNPFSRAIMFSDAHRPMPHHREARCLLHGQGKEAPAKGERASRAPRCPRRRHQTPSAQPTQDTLISGDAQQSRGQEREENRNVTEGICGGEGNTGQEGKADTAKGRTHRSLSKKQHSTNKSHFGSYLRMLLFSIAQHPYCLLLIGGKDRGRREAHQEKVLHQ